MRLLIAPTLVLIAAAAAARGDAVYTRDGRTILGKLHRHGPAAWQVDGGDGRSTVVPESEVESIELTARPPTDPAAARRRLDAVRKAAAGADPANAADRFRELIAGGADAATLGEAKAELAVWQDRADRHLARLGNRWIPAAAQEEAVRDALVTAGHARSLVKAGQLNQAEPLLLAALKVDPQCAAAHYLLGLVHAAHGQAAAAARAFAAADVEVPNRPATLNNLAVLAWQRREFLPSLALYDRALVLAPAEPLVLDNVAAALADLPPALSAQPVVGRVVQRLVAGRKRFTAAMTQLGLHPIGQRWLTDAQFAEAQQEQARGRQQLDALSAEFDAQQDAIRQTDLQAAGVEQQMRRSTVSGDVGPLLASYDRGGPPAVYFELSNDGDQLQRRRATQVAKLNDLAKQAAALTRRIAGLPPDGPRPQFLVGPEGTPARLPNVP